MLLYNDFKYERIRQTLIQRGHGELKVRLYNTFAMIT